MCLGNIKARDVIRTRPMISDARAAMVAGARAHYGAVGLSQPRYGTASGVICSYSCIGGSKRKDAMPSPHQFDLPSRKPLLPCPDCFKLMRIAVIEADEGREHIKMVCEGCGSKETLARPANPHVRMQ